MTADAFSIAPGAIAAILAATAVTYVWRAGGFWIMGFITPSPRLHRALAALPGSIVAAIVLPAIARTGVVAAIAIGVALGVRIWRGNDILALVSGVAVAAALRALGA